MLDDTGQKCTNVTSNNTLNKTSTCNLIRKTEATTQSNNAVWKGGAPISEQRYTSAQFYYLPYPGT